MAELSKIKDLQIFAELHKGFAATVYKAYQKSLERTVLLKVLNSEFANSKERRTAFQREAKLAAKIQHPNVVALYHFESSQELAYFTTEFVEGLDLRTLLTSNKKLPPELALFMLKEVTMGLQAAHRLGIWHRDIKPENILISGQGEVKLGDFGMAGLQNASDVKNEAAVGTISYFSPEQILGESLSEATDIFALGATFYEMLCRVKPVARFFRRFWKLNQHHF